MGLSELYCSPLTGCGLMGPKRPGWPRRAPPSAAHCLGAREGSIAPNLKLNMLKQGHTELTEGLGQFLEESRAASSPHQVSPLPQTGIGPEPHTLYLVEVSEWTESTLEWEPCWWKGQNVEVHIQIKALPISVRAGMKLSKLSGLGQSWRNGAMDPYWSSMFDARLIRASELKPCPRA